MQIDTVRSAGRCSIAEMLVGVNKCALLLNQSTPIYARQIKPNQNQPKVDELHKCKTICQWVSVKLNPDALSMRVPRANRTRLVGSLNG